MPRMTKIHIEYATQRKLCMACTTMAQEWGKHPIYWLKELQTTSVYLDIMNPKTHVFSEGVAYIMDCYRIEKGIPLDQ